MGLGGSNNEQEVKMKKEAALIRRWRWATAEETRLGEKGIGSVCRVCQTNGAGPCGKEIIIGSVSVKHCNTMQKKGKRGGGGWGRGGPRATVQPSEGPRGPGRSAATRALPKNVCNPRAD